jgi:hypothetical protein
MALILWMRAVVLYLAFNECREMNFMGDSFAGASLETRNAGAPDFAREPSKSLGNSGGWSNHTADSAIPLYRPEFCGRKGVLPVILSKSVLNARFLFLPVALLLLSSSVVRAQVPKGDVYLGFSRTGSDTFYSGAGGLNGWEGALHVKMHKPFLGIEGDLSHYGLGANSTVPRTTAFLLGPRLTVGALGPKVFAHALIGGEHSSNSGGTISGGALAYAVGGGLDLPIFPLFAWRFGGDYIHAVGRSPSGGTPARFSTGLVFRF